MTLYKILYFVFWISKKERKYLHLDMTQRGQNQLELNIIHNSTQSNYRVAYDYT